MKALNPRKNRALNASILAQTMATWGAVNARRAAVTAGSLRQPNI